jgi:sec-independent protein translocase protein TatA
MNVTSVFAIFGVGPLEIAAVLLVILLLFGSQKLPVLMRSIGKSANEFKKGLNETDEEADAKEKNV